MNNFKYYNRNGVRVSAFELIIHENSYPLESIVAYKSVDSNTLPRLGILFMLIGALLIIDEGDLFIIGGILFFIGLLTRFSMDPAYSLVLTTSYSEKPVLTTTSLRDIELLIEALNHATQDNKKRIKDLGSILEPPIQRVSGT
jgi:hypothetical protein